jgi:hypothetical protein
MAGVGSWQGWGEGRGQREGEMVEGGKEGRGGQAHGWGSDQGCCERGRGEGFTAGFSLIPGSLVHGGRRVLLEGDRGMRCVQEVLLLGGSRDMYWSFFYVIRYKN